jgi:hypothetical protein
LCTNVVKYTILKLEKIFFSLKGLNWQDFYQFVHANSPLDFEIYFHDSLLTSANLPRKRRTQIEHLYFSKAVYQEIFPSVKSLPGKEGKTGLNLTFFKFCAT